MKSKFARVSAFVLAIVLVSNTANFTTANASVISDSINTFQTVSGSSMSSLAEVSSMNNNINNCYYRPKLNELYELEAALEDKYEYVNAYTGAFDVDWSEPYKPQSTQSRALEILGYDFLLDSEKITGSTPDTYTVVKTSDTPSRGTVIMDIYKALGINKLSYYVNIKGGSGPYLEYSAASAGVDRDLIKTKDRHDTEAPDTGRVDLVSVFVTRTEQAPYLEKAQKDLMYNISQKNNRITGQEFIIMVAEMMEFYGKEVLSESEMNQLLQVYGAKIPTNLSARGQQAFLYLKSRGVLNVDISYSDYLKLDDMLDVLMCVYDESSRTNYKEIQIVSTVDSELQSNGYFNKDITIIADPTAIDMEVEYDYTTATYYDYYVKVTDQSKFRDTSGVESTSLFIPSVPGEPESEELAGSRYLGIESGYYHFQIPIIDSSSEYMRQSGGYYQINTKVATDIPYYIFIEAGGGVYDSFEAIDDGNAYVSRRRSFNADEHTDSVDKERKAVKDKVNNLTASASIISTAKTALSKLWDATALTVKAAPVSVDGSSTQLSCKVTINNWYETYCTYDTSLVTSFSYNPTNHQAVFTLKSVDDVAAFKASINIKGKQGRYAFNAISNIDGAYLININDLVNVGLIQKPSDSTMTGSFNCGDNAYKFITVFGEVRVNTQTKQVIVGSTIYDASDTEYLVYSYTPEGSDEVTLLVDYRLAFGWTFGVVSTVDTGNTITDGGVILNVKTLTTVSNGNINLSNLPFTTKRKMKSWSIMNTGSNSQTVLTVNPMVSESSDDIVRVMLTTTTGLQNFIVYEGRNYSTGLEEDWLFVFYPKYAFSDASFDAYDEMVGITKLTYDFDDYVVRKFALSKDESVNAGELGKVTYIEGVGYVYNCPTDWDMDKYLSGEYWLPICVKSNSTGDSETYKLYDCNFNYFKGYPYGTRPVEDTDEEAVRYDGEIVSVTKDDSISDFGDMYPAPIGMVTFFGRTEGNTGLEVLQANSSLSDSYFNSGASDLYYGSSICSVEAGNGKTKISIDFRYTPKYSLEVEIPDTTRIYKVQEKMSGLGKDSSTNLYSWAILDKLELVKDVGTNLDYTSVELVDAEDRNVYDGTLQMKLKSIIKQIDEKASFILLLCYYIVPIIGFALSTILAGLSFITQTKLVQKIFAKTIDIVWVLSFGRITAKELDWTKGVKILIVCYCVFGLMLNGNVVRVIAGLCEWFSSLEAIIRNI